MKRLLALLAIPAVVYGQVINFPGDRNTMFGLRTNNGADIAYRAFTATTDTTEIIDISRHRLIVLALQSYDSSSIIIKRQLSLDGTNWIAASTHDSLKQSSDVTVMKLSDLSSVCYGAKYVRFLFQFSPAAYALGTTSAYYTAMLWLRTGS